MHDMGIFTGGCHYDNGCGRFVRGCGQCPQLGSANPHDLSSQIWQRKYTAFAQRPPELLHFVGASEWTAEQARRSPLLKQHEVSVVPYGLDTRVFAPRGRWFSRQLLGLPVDRRIILTGAASLDNPRKGLAYVYDSIRESMPRDWLLVTIGRLASKVPGTSSAQVNLGELCDDRLLSAAYSAADVFVIPSLQEAFGQTAMEAQACGTAVVGFDVGGIRDVVRPGETGLLVPCGNSQALREAIIRLIEAPNWCRQLGQQGREVAVREYALRVQACRHINLYQKLISRATLPT